MLNIKLNYCNPIRVLYVKDVDALEQERHYELRKSSRNRQVQQHQDGSITLNDLKIHEDAASLNYIIPCGFEYT